MDKIICDKNYWVLNIRHEMFREMDLFMKKNGFDIKQTAKATGISIADVSRVLNEDFDGDLEKAIEIMLKIGRAPNFSFIPLEDVKRKMENVPKTLGVGDIEKIKTALDDNNSSINSDSLRLAYDMETKVDDAKLQERRKHQKEAEEVLNKLVKPYVPLMQRKGRSGPYFQMQDVLLACGELNKRERMAINWLLKQANAMHDAYEKDRQP